MSMAPRPSVKVNWKPSRPSEFSVTSTALKASTIGAGAGTAIVGPSQRVSRVPRSEASIGLHLCLWHLYAQHPANLCGQISRMHRVIGIAHPPELLRGAQRTGRDQVEPVALGHADLTHQL